MRGAHFRLLVIAVLIGLVSIVEGTLGLSEKDELVVLTSHE